MAAGSRRRRPASSMAPIPLSVSAPSASPTSWRLRRRPIAAAGAALLLLAAAVAVWRPDYLPAALLRRPPPAVARFYSFDLVREYPHDPEAFTQGLLYGGNDTLFESTGLYHQSSVRKVDLQTGKVLDQHQMDGHMFGEGLTLLGDRLFQVTWLKNDGFIYDLHNFSKRESFTHKMRDGWGLATDGKILFGSDGTSRLYQLDPVSLEVTKTVTVKYQDNEVSYINELEYINGEVWANVWQTDCIARVSHEDGQVVSWIFLHELRQQLWKSGNTDIDVLNGIAWDEENDRLFVTGKLWPKLYEIKLRPVDGLPDGSVEKLCPRARFYR
ncbi:glutaminyl-peptide cyclotransferase [Hordeum vulgare subsp. vulgare]|uniref:Glutaminyl-peptide cyclotransferase n=1 Tax=Hordeum vulgare subsp. vulgare TaxID=112509 RepID=A0A8I7B6B4_HORVV|nr:glutaminyl-peptide cyclotransferase [Hordeum vulgare subsp. vulgare]